MTGHKKPGKCGILGGAKRAGFSLRTDLRRTKWAKQLPEVPDDARAQQYGRLYFGNQASPSSTSIRGRRNNFILSGKKETSPVIQAIKKLIASMLSIHIYKTHH